MMLLMRLSNPTKRGVQPAATKIWFDRHAAHAEPAQTQSICAARYTHQEPCYEVR
jgi:hypothetical protein